MYTKAVRNFLHLYNIAVPELLSPNFHDHILTPPKTCQFLFFAKTYPSALRCNTAKKNKVDFDESTVDLGQILIYSLP